MPVAATLNFFNSPYMPHIHCYLGQPPLVWTMFTTDLLIGLAYFCISVTLWGLVRKIKLRFSLVILCFGAFIGACGVTHFMEVWTLWHPDYWLAAFFKIVTAVASIGTAIYLILLWHDLVAVAEAAKVSEEHRLNLESLTRELESRVSERTAEVAENERRFNLAMSAAQVGVWEWDLKTDGVILNGENSRLYGLELPHDLQRTLPTILERIYPEDRDRVTTSLRLAATEKREFRAEFRVLTPDAGIRWLLSVGRAEYDSAGQPSRMFGTNTNITDRKLAEERNRDFQRKLESSESRLRLVTNSIPQLAWMTDAKGYIVWYNQRWFDYTGTTLEQMQGWGWTKVHREDFTEKVTEKWLKHLASGEDWEDTFPLRAADGSFRWFLSRARADHDADGSIRGWFGTNTDITDQLENERELKESKVIAERASQAKTQLLANMSHEIRTPLGAIIGYTDLLKDRSTSEAEKIGFLDTIERNSHHLLRLVDDILDLSKVEAGKIALEETTAWVGELLEDVGAVMNVRAQDQGIIFKTEYRGLLPDQVLIDPLRLKQVLMNIVGNAIKFTHKGQVTLALEYAAPNFKFTVTDSGIGIAPDQIKTLFQPFSQADPSMTRRYGGTGLGLILSKRLCQALGGDLVLESSVEHQGTVFVATVKAALVEKSVLGRGRPPQSKPAGTKTTSPREDNVLEGLKILLIEDSHDNQLLIKTYLASAGAHVDLADNGLIGFEKAMKTSPDVVVMDVQMPVLDGHQTTRRLRAAGFSKPIIALTAHAMREEKERCLESGCTDYLTKPVQRAHLIQLLSRYLP